MIRLWWAGATTVGATLSLQGSPPDRLPLMVDRPICALSRGAYCVLGGEGDVSVTRRGSSHRVRIQYDGRHDVLVTEPNGCGAALSRAPYLLSVSRRRSRIIMVFRLHRRCDLTVSAPDHLSEERPHGIVIALTQIQMCTSPPCEGRPLATLISRRALGWPD